MQEEQETEEVEKGEGGLPKVKRTPLVDVADLSHRVGRPCKQEKKDFNTLERKERRRRKRRRGRRRWRSRSRSLCKQCQHEGDKKMFMTRTVCRHIVLFVCHCNPTPVARGYPDFEKTSEKKKRRRTFEERFSRYTD